MKNFKLLNLLLEIDETTDCEAGTKVTINQTEYANMPDSANYHYFKDTRSNYFKCKKKGSKPKEKEEEKPVVAGKCPSDDGYGNKDFQEWVWKTYLGKTETDKVTTKLCGLKNGKAKSCIYSVGVDGNCQDGTKAVWLELRDKFIDF